MQKRFFMLHNTLDTYRWVGPVEDENKWENRLVSVREEPVAPSWKTVPLEWLPETIERSICDFPQFWPGILCISKRAVSVLSSYLIEAGEILPVSGLDDEFVAFHCLRDAVAMNGPATEVALRRRKGFSFHSPTFVPVLNFEQIPNSYDIFRLPDSFQKTFVSDKFKDAYERAGLTGLDFISVAQPH